MSNLLDRGVSRRLFLQLGSVVAAPAAVGCNSEPAPQPAANQPPSEAIPAAAEMVPGPIPGTRLSDGYVSQVGRSIYLWGWPMVNVHNRRIVMGKVPEPGYMSGIVPVAPPNQLAMLHDYVVPEERVVA